MDEFSRVTPSTSSNSGIGFLVAAVIVVLVLLYALFAGGSVSTTVDPASVGATEESAPLVEEVTPVQPVAPATDN